MNGCLLVDLIRFLTVIKLDILFVGSEASSIFSECLGLTTQNSITENTDFSQHSHYTRKVCRDSCLVLLNGFCKLTNYSLTLTRTFTYVPTPVANSIA